MPEFNSGNKKEPSWFSSFGLARKPGQTAENQKENNVVNFKQNNATDSMTSNLDSQSTFSENQVTQESANKKTIIEGFDSFNNIRTTSEQIGFDKSISAEKPLANLQMDGLKKADKASFTCMVGSDQGLHPRPRGWPGRGQTGLKKDPSPCMVGGDHDQVAPVSSRVTMQAQQDKKPGFLGEFNSFSKSSQNNNPNTKFFGLPKLGPPLSGSTMQAQTIPKAFGNPSKNKVVSITYEEIGLFPRSFSRVFDRFFKQIFSDVENLVIQEYRFYRYLFLTTIKTLCILFFVPLFVNFIAKTYLIRPITEYYWNTQQTEIFLNSYEQKRAFSELHDFEEKLYFELFLEASKNQSLLVSKNPLLSPLIEKVNPSEVNQVPLTKNTQSSVSGSAKPTESALLSSTLYTSTLNEQENQSLLEGFNTAPTKLKWDGQAWPPASNNLSQKETLPKGGVSIGTIQLSTQGVNNSTLGPAWSDPTMQGTVSQLSLFDYNSAPGWSAPAIQGPAMQSPLDKKRGLLGEQEEKTDQQPGLANVNQGFWPQNKKSLQGLHPRPRGWPGRGPGQSTILGSQTSPVANTPSINKVVVQSNYDAQSAPYTPEDQTAQSMVTNLQDKILELAIRYNNHSIEAITNFFADFLSLISLFYLLVSLEIQINITKSFLLEVFFGLDDSKKSLLILIMTDLLVGYHSSNLWELFFQFLFNHYGIPESQTGIFLLVATLPVLLDVLFKYLIFRHLNRSSPATVATYHAIIE